MFLSFNSDIGITVGYIRGCIVSTMDWSVEDDKCVIALAYFFLKLFYKYFAKIYPTNLIGRNSLLIVLLILGENCMFIDK